MERVMQQVSLGQVELPHPMVSPPGSPAPMVCGDDHPGPDSTPFVLSELSSSPPSSTFSPSGSNRPQSPEPRLAGTAQDPRIQTNVYAGYQPWLEQDPRIRTHQLAEAAVGTTRQDARVHTRPVPAAVRPSPPPATRRRLYSIAIHIKALFTILTTGGGGVCG
jgi:hypothetical protein